MENYNKTVSIIIPARNEIFLARTIEDIFKKAKTNIEVIVVLDGYWPNPTIQDNDDLHLIHFSEQVGMRKAINAGVDLAKGKYIIKVDAHCSFQKRFDYKLIRDHKPQQCLIPNRYELDTDTWNRTDKLYPPEYIERGTLKGRKWPEYNSKGDLVKLMTFQGSFWFMERKFFYDIGGLDDVNYGSMGREAQEICLKTWTNNGECILDRNVWYAHWNKPSEFVIPDMKKEKEKSKQYALSYWTEDKLKPLIDKFAPVPSWENKQDNPIVVKEQTTKLFPKMEESIIGVSKPELHKGMNRTNIYEMFASKGFTVGAEIGVLRGANAENMFEKIPNLSLYLIDPYVDYEGSRIIRGEKQISAYKTMRERMHNKKATILKMKSEEAIAFVPDNILDFVYIDGNHTYSYTLLDIILWNRKVKIGGIIAGHDYYQDNKHNIGVKRAVSDYTNAMGIKLHITDKMAEKNKNKSRQSWWFEKI